ncbi:MULTISPECIES: aminotransferase class I/II-fold pyridoxal phosphate-dependent enzyme [Tenebrionibacter/Tenebrionicola group]|uniref:aminotransferase class I/II-fold pyridoxal phosphate-dependent enzyme n=1 Tax=Tenebrionibacter/Tenebrionicola group TaxID=2969848 RepID=UPI0037DA138C
MTGWKVGYCIAPAAWSAELRKVRQYLTFSVNSPAQLALADMLRAGPEHYRELPRVLPRTTRSVCAGACAGALNCCLVKAPVFCWRTIALFHRRMTWRFAAG